MYTSTPQNYICPICLGIRGVESEHTMLRPEDLIFKNELVSVFMNSFFRRGNEGHVIVVPNEHIENIYELPGKTGGAILEAAKVMSLAIKKAYHCDGITLRQNNEPAGDQHAFHFHLHVFPRYHNDSFSSQTPHDKVVTTLEDRQPYIAKLRAAMGER
jgi:histidine triad (HIT) family protein